ncbi:MAG: 4-hydroxybenzoate octaprenyltransferase [Gammaproteobacteria bacterium]|jgi:4-hydroxybenzoate polyprenyltransferase|nr:4-hydroxybenzoate octaprenyltransferase [Gammaproteobacteria bacterium]
MIAERLRQYALLARLHRPIGILLLLWPALWGLWIAGHGKPDPVILTIFVLGVVLMRSAGCVINDYADRNFDPHVTRTHDRPIAAGRVTSREALSLFVVLSLAAFGLVLQLNLLTIQLSVVAIIFAVSYPFLKRYTHLPQFYLGAAFGWSIPMGFAAQTNALPAVVWVLFVANIFWAVAYDTQYSMVDRDDDIKIGVKSTAILFGAYDNLLIGLAHAMTLALLVLAGVLVGLGVFYYLGLAAAAGLAAYQQRLTHDRQHDGCFRAFLNNNWFGAAVFSGLMLDYLYVRIT